MLKKIWNWFKAHKVSSVVGGALIFFVTLFGTFPDLEKYYTEHSKQADTKARTEYSVLSLGFDLGESGLIHSDALHLLTASDEALEKAGLERKKLEKLARTSRIEIGLYQSRYEHLGIKINIKEAIIGIEQQHEVVWGKVKHRELIKKLSNLTFSSIRDVHGNRVADIFFLAFFCKFLKQNGLGMYDDEYVSDYNELAMLINSKLKLHGLAPSIENATSDPERMVHEIQRLESLLKSEIKRPLT